MEGAMTRPSSDGVKGAQNSQNLRPLLKQRNPQQPKVMTPQQLAKQNRQMRRVSTAPANHEPLYRKARMASAYKEMVKVPSPYIGTNTGNGGVPVTLSSHLLRLDDDLAGEFGSQSNHVGDNFRYKYAQKVKQLQQGSTGSEPEMGSPDGVNAGQSMDDSEVTHNSIMAGFGVNGGSASAPATAGGVQVGDTPMLPVINNSGFSANVDNEMTGGRKKIGWNPAAGSRKQTFGGLETIKD
jgi:hypothetical protein